MASVIFGGAEEAKTVMDYQPKKLTLNVTAQAKDFVGSQPEGPDVSFRISELIAQQNGIQDLERASLEKRIEGKALEKLKEIQESAYREAYNIGLDEGQLKGYEESKQAITERLQVLNELVEKFGRIKNDILQRNEVQIIDFIYYLASKVAYFEIEKNPERILPVLKNAIESLQKDERMLIKISPQDFATIEDLRKKSGNNFEYLSNAKLESVDTLKPGGCLIETNFGLIDATVEERLSKLWETLETVKPLTKKDKFE